MSAPEIDAIAAALAAEGRSVCSIAFALVRRRLARNLDDAMAIAHRAHRRALL